MTKEELKKWREKHKLSQQGIADLLGVYQESVARWEIGTRKIPSFLHLALIGLEKTKIKGGKKGYGLHNKKERKAGY